MHGFAILYSYTAFISQNKNTFCQMKITLKNIKSQVYSIKAIPYIYDRNGDWTWCTGCINMYRFTIICKLYLGQSSAYNITSAGTNLTR